MSQLIPIKILPHTIEYNGTPKRLLDIVDVIQVISLIPELQGLPEGVYSKEVNPDDELDYCCLLYLRYEVNDGSRIRLMRSLVAEWSDLIGRNYLLYNFDNKLICTRSEIPYTLIGSYLAAYTSNQFSYYFRATYTEPVPPQTPPSTIDDINWSNSNNGISMEDLWMYAYPDPIKGVLVGYPIFSEVFLDHQLNPIEVTNPYKLIDILGECTQSVNSLNLYENMLPQDYISDYISLDSMVYESEEIIHVTSDRIADREKDRLKESYEFIKTIDGQDNFVYYEDSKSYNLIKSKLNYLDVIEVQIEYVQSNSDSYSILREAEPDDQLTNIQFNLDNDTTVSYGELDSQVDVIELSIVYDTILESNNFTLYITEDSIIAYPLHPENISEFRFRSLIKLS